MQQKAINKVFTRHPMCINDSNHYYILEGIKRIDNIKYKRDMNVDDNEEQFI